MCRLRFLLRFRFSFFFSYKGQIMDPESRMDSRSTVFDDVLYVNPALRAVTFSSTLPLLDNNQEAAENAFLIELARECR